VTWVPSTRGVDGTITLCSTKACVHANERTDQTTVDFLEARYFCPNHWAEMCEFFAFVRKCSGCKRSHEAEAGSAIHIDMLKFQQKCYEPCDKHLEGYFDNFMLEIW
jgi:hypothetical protein